MRHYGGTALDARWLSSAFPSAHRGALRTFFYAPGNLYASRAPRGTPLLSIASSCGSPSASRTRLLLSCSTGPSQRSFCIGQHLHSTRRSFCTSSPLKCHPAGGGRPPTGAAQSNASTRQDPSSGREADAAGGTPLDSAAARFSKAHEEQAAGEELSPSEVASAPADVSAMAEPWQRSPRGDDNLKADDSQAPPRAAAASAEPAAPDEKNTEVDAAVTARGAPPERRDGIHISEDPADIPITRVVSKVLSYLWKPGDHKLKLLVVGSVASVLLAKVLKVAVPFWFKTIVDVLAPQSAVAGAVATVGPFTVGAFGCVVAYGICRLTASVADECKTLLFAPVGGHASTALAMEMFNKLHHLDLKFHLNRETGVLSKDLDRGSRAFWSLAYTLLFMVVPTAFEMTLVCVALNAQAGPQFIVIALSAVASYVAWTYAVTNWRARFRTRYNKLDSRVGGLIVDSLLNYETVKYFRREQYESDRIRAATTKMNAQLIRLDQSMAVLNFGQQFIFVVAGVASLYMATCGVLAGAMTVGDLVLVDALLMQLYMPLSFLGMIYREVQSSTQNMQAMIALLDQHATITDATDAVPYEYRNGTIELRHVGFEYRANQHRPILRDLSLTIPGGKTVAFVGPSGSGKSTIFRLLFRFYDPTRGGIYIDGQPLSKLRLASVREKIGVIPQDTVLFNESVMYNIRYSRLDATDAEVIDAAKKASLHDTVRRMDHGYDTSVGERGLKLSGGEKQRVAIARVLLGDLPILLADEATSALDSSTEVNVMETLKQATRREAARTIILIAHRLTTVCEADIIFVLDGKGGLAEQGTHRELLRKGGVYASLWYEQLRETSHKALKNRSTSAEESDTTKIT